MCVTRQAMTTGLVNRAANKHVLTAIRWVQVLAQREIVGGK